MIFQLFIVKFPFVSSSVFKASPFAETLIVQFSIVNLSFHLIQSSADFTIIFQLLIFKSSFDEIQSL